MHDESGQACHICLGDEPNIIIWHGVCPCRPSVHRECMAVWLAERPYTCPICLNVTVKVDRVYHDVADDGRCCSTACCNCCCCVGICCLTVFITPLYYVLWGLNALGCWAVNRPNQIRMEPVGRTMPPV